MLSILALVMIFVSIVSVVSGLVFICSAFLQMRRTDYRDPKFEKLSRMNTVGFVLNNAGMILGFVALLVAGLAR